jgi:hypothetical protein
MCAAAAQLHPGMLQPLCSAASSKQPHASAPARMLPCVKPDHFEDVDTDFSGVLGGVMLHIGA